MMMYPTCIKPSFHEHKNILVISNIRSFTWLTELFILAPLTFQLVIFNIFNHWSLYFFLYILDTCCLPSISVLEYAQSTFIIFVFLKSLESNYSNINMILVPVSVYQRIISHLLSYYYISETLFSPSYPFRRYAQSPFIKIISNHLYMDIHNPIFTSQ